jgi:hypothetical protein
VPSYVVINTDADVTIARRAVAGGGE